MKAYGYIRVSTTMQSQDGVSLGNQRDRIQALCVASGYDLCGMFEDSGLSGSKVSNRNGLKTALDTVTKEKAVLVVYSLSRLSRSITDAIEITKRLQKSGSALVSICEKIDLTSASGAMLFHMLCVFSQGERAQLAERVKSAMQFKKRQGRRVGTVPFGWDLASDMQTLVENPTEQATLSRILELTAEGKSLKAIVEKLEAQGCRTKLGGPWKRESVRQIVKRNQILKVAA